MEQQLSRCIQNQFSSLDLGLSYRPKVSGLGRGYFLALMVDSILLQGFRHRKGGQEVRRSLEDEEQYTMQNESMNRDSPEPGTTRQAAGDWDRRKGFQNWELLPVETQRGSYCPPPPPAHTPDSDQQGRSRLPLCFQKDHNPGHT